MSTRPSYAVIIPIYNVQPKYFSECLASVSQAASREPLTAVKVVAVDDGSAESLAIEYRNIAEQALGQGLDVAYLSHGRQQGIAAARATAIAGSSAEWLLLLDSDDLLEPETFTALAEIPSSVMLGFTAHRKVSENLSDIIEVRRKRRYYQMLTEHAGTVDDPFLHYTFLIHLHVIRRAAYDAVGGFDSTLWHGDEIDFHLRLTDRFRDPSDYHYVDQVLYTYRDNPVGVCRDPERYADLISTIERILLQHARRRGMFAATCHRAGKENDGAVRYSYTQDPADPASA